MGSEYVIREKGTKIYKIKADGGIEEVATTPDNLKTVRIVIDHERRIIWLWKESEEVSVKLRFLGAHEVKKLHTLYPSYKLKDVTAGDEPAEFLDAIRNPTGEIEYKEGFKIEEPEAVEKAPKEETEKKKEEVKETKETKVSAATLLLGVEVSEKTIEKAPEKTIEKAPEKTIEKAPEKTIVETKTEKMSSSATEKKVIHEANSARVMLIVSGRIEGKEVKYEVPFQEEIRALITTGENVEILVPVDSRVLLKFEKKGGVRQCDMCDEWTPEEEITLTKKGKRICKKCVEELKTMGM
ncbi:MAG: hypothetical protein QXL15_00420 [Candidatus Korarchaeota archaeon]